MSTGHPLLDEFNEKMLRPTARYFAKHYLIRYDDAWNHLAVALLHVAGELRMPAECNYGKLAKYRTMPEPNRYLQHSLKTSMRRELTRRYQTWYGGDHAILTGAKAPLAFEAPCGNNETLGDVVAGMPVPEPVSHGTPSDWLEEMRVKYPTLVCWAEEGGSDHAVAAVQGRSYFAVQSMRYKELKRARKELVAA